ncbi:hypothetical protein ACET6Z_05570 [Aeromonas veronii]
MNLKQAVSDGYIKNIYVTLLVFIFLFSGSARSEITLSAVENLNSSMLDDRVIARGRVSCSKPNSGFRVWFNNSPDQKTGGDKGVLYEVSSGRGINVFLNFDGQVNKSVGLNDVVVRSPDEAIFFEVIANERRQIYPGSYSLSLSAECILTEVF